MLEFIDVIKWPLALIVCFVIALLMFRSAVTTLLGRAQRAGFGKSAIDFGPAPAEQQKALEPPTNTPVSTVPADAIRPPPMEIYAGIENETKTALEASKYPLELQNAWLMRAAAVFRVMRDHEIAYRLILGSQIDLLLAANTAPLPNMARARETFDAAKARSPDIYTTSVSTLGFITSS